ncbi:heterokaryon incompatibility protein-domain-containing protein [Lasiosphaeris hirsuta]|uniref:Heterokaryon incompatibility protein-domain-containing protein n=1 Tax=Lasiosphaeris hirsuta TaxID=260670 RepID=A0AA40DRH4_9PEZI|nr:heterokaryon incompatibility protein-domain-containing protein [Lasiosphaeris hirsuta]
MLTSDHEASVVNKLQFGRIPTSGTTAEEALNICSSWLEQYCITAGTVQFVSGFSSWGDRYVALSHRWVAGVLPSWTTTLANVAERTTPRTFDVDQLPAAIQDAMLLTYKLGIRYIWTDSLCIIQDSEEEWKAESVKMSTVFGCASVTIFTDSAVDDSDLFLRERTATSFQKRQGIQVEVEGANGFFLLHLVEQYSRYAKELPAKTAELFRVDVVQSRLSTRGCIFQEQVISRRRLHFGSHQMCTRSAGSISSGGRQRPPGLLSPVSYMVVQKFQNAAIRHGHSVSSDESS